MTALNFPANPTNGQTYENYVYDGTDGVWKRISPGGTLGNIDDVTIDSPADGESLVYDSATGDWINADATVEVYGVNTAATDYFMIPVGGDADRPVTPANGHIRFNSDSGSPEWYSAANDEWVLFKNGPSVAAEVLLIGGGAGGGGDWGGGGGAGAYIDFLTNITEPLTVTVGAGGGGTIVGNSASVGNGNDSVFGETTANGGGGGGSYNSGAGASNGNASGGGGAGQTGAGATGGAYGNAGSSATSSQAGGGGGAGEAGGTDALGYGGDGLASSITGSSVIRAGGGGGGYLGPGLGGDGGGGNGGGSSDGLPGAANTGGGGGGGWSGPHRGGPGGSGIVIVKYPLSYTASASVGLTSNTVPVGEYKITTFTAGTGTVTFS